MFAITETYTDFNGNEQTETFLFNLNVSEMMDIDRDEIHRILNEGTESEVNRYFRDLLLKAYGKKSDDGKRFIKSKEISEEFESSAAFSDVLFDILSTEESAANFIKKLLPDKVRQKVEDQTKAEDAKA